MSADVLTERLFEALINGDRPGARRVIAEQRERGIDAEIIMTDLFWPTYELIDSLHRRDKITNLSYNLATRLLRVLVDQSAAELVATPAPRLNRRVFAACGPSEGLELGAQMAVDLLEANGFDVRFSGGGVPTDEVQALVQQDSPDVLLMFCSSPQDLPSIRQLIDTLHEVGACPNLQIVVGGGVFNRAEGLAEEIGADLWAVHPLELVDAMIEEHDRRATDDQRTVGRKRRLDQAA
ncbi:MAG: cobalamin-dependent protein [Planctomycetota bacterium]